MGIHIDIAIAKSITKRKWSAVYKESLKMIASFPLAEFRAVDIDGVDTRCLVRTAEREDVYFWCSNEIKAGWNAIGDYESMHYAENYSLPRDLVKENAYVERCEDAMYGTLPYYLGYRQDDARFRCIYKLWGNKTQGEPYHMYLLAIACMIEHRLGNQAFIYGDITRGQCVEAVRMANEILRTPIDVPARCDPERLLARVMTLPISQKDKLRVFVKYYLGDKDAAVGLHIQRNFSSRTCGEYWKERLGEYSINLLGFDLAFEDYIRLGFDLSKMCKYVRIEDADDKSGKSQYDAFVRRVLDTKLHLKEKDFEDPLKIDQNDPEPYGIPIYDAQFAYAWARNKKVDRYISIEDIRNALIKGIGDKCDVNRVIDEYLQEESEQQKIEVSSMSTAAEYLKACKQDASETFKQALSEKVNRIQADNEEYDIYECEDLIYYEPGDTIHPEIAAALHISFDFYTSMLEDEHYKQLMLKSPLERCKHLSEQNKTLVITDEDWRYIYDDIREDEDAYARYYPAVWVKITNDDTMGMVKGIILNDDLYEYCLETAETMKITGGKQQ